MRSILLGLMLVFALQNHAQTGVISADELNVLYVGLDNPISVAIPGVPANKTVVKTSAGYIQKRDSQYLVLIPERKGNEAIVTIGKVHKKDTTWVYSKKFRIRNVPEPKIRFGALSADVPVFLSSLKIQSIMVAVLENFTYSGIKCPVLSYHAHFFGRNIGYKKLIAHTASLAPIREFLDEFSTADFIVFDSVEVYMPGRKYFAPPFMVEFIHDSSSPLTDFHVILSDRSIKSLRDKPNTIQYLHGPYKLYSIPLDSTGHFFSMETDSAGGTIQYLYITKTDTFLSLKLPNYGLMIKRNSYRAEGKLDFSQCQNFDTTNASRTEWPSEGSDTNRFIHLFNGAPGYWRYYYKSKLIAEGNLKYTCYNRTDQYCSQHGYSSFLRNHVREKMFSIEPCPSNKDCGVNRYWWYLQADTNFKIYDVSAFHAFLDSDPKKYE